MMSNFSKLPTTSKKPQHPKSKSNSPNRSATSQNVKEIDQQTRIISIKVNSTQQ